jgi:hypothetical protein
MWRGRREQFWRLCQEILEISTRNRKRFCLICKVRYEFYHKYNMGAVSDWGIFSSNVLQCEMTSYRNHTVLFGQQQHELFIPSRVLSSANDLHDFQYSSPISSDNWLVYRSHWRRTDRLHKHDSAHANRTWILTYLDRTWDELRGFSGWAALTSSSRFENSCENSVIDKFSWRSFSNLDCKRHDVSVMP